MEKPYDLESLFLETWLELNPKLNDEALEEIFVELDQKVEVNVWFVNPPFGNPAHPADAGALNPPGKAAKPLELLAV